MKLLVCGGRHYNNVAVIWRVLDDMHAKTPIEILMQGGALGAAHYADQWAKMKTGIRRFVCRPGDLHGNWKPDLVLAFPGGLGTADMVAKALAVGIPVEKVG